MKAYIHTGIENCRVCPRYFTNDGRSFLLGRNIEPYREAGYCRETMQEIPDGDIRASVIPSWCPLPEAEWVKIEQPKPKKRKK